MRYMIFFTDNQYYDTEDRPVENFDIYLYELRKYGGGMTPDFFNSADSIVEAVEIFQRAKDYNKPLALVDENENWKVVETWNPDSDKKPVKIKKTRQGIIDELIDDGLLSMDTNELEEVYRDFSENGVKGYNDYTDDELKDVYLDVFYMGEYEPDELEIIGD